MEAGGKRRWGILDRRGDGGDDDVSGGRSGRRGGVRFRAGHVSSVFGQRGRDLTWEEWFHVS